MVDFSPMVDRIIVDNVTGNIHILKAAYDLCTGALLFKNTPETGGDELKAALTDMLRPLFAPLDDEFGEIYTQGATDPTKEGPLLHEWLQQPV